MEQNPSWEANVFTAHQIPRILWNPRVHDRIHKSPPPLRILSHIIPAYTPTTHFLNIHIIIILPSILGLPSGLFSSGFPTKILHTSLLFPKRATCPVHMKKREYTAEK